MQKINIFFPFIYASSVDLKILKHKTTKKNKHNTLTIMELKDSNGADDDRYVIFKQDDLFSESFPLMKEIRRQGKLCDVTLKVYEFIVNLR